MYLCPLIHVWPDQVIGSSLLFVHDHSSMASVWMIDFGKTTPMSGTRQLLHNVPWTEGSGEDGYLIGLTSLITALSQAVDMTAGQMQDGSTGERSDTWRLWLRFYNPQLLDQEKIWIEYWNSALFIYFKRQQRNISHEESHCMSYGT